MRIGIFADKPSASTGFSVVCSNLAKQLSNYYDLEIYYFGRFGRKQGFAKKAILTDDGYYYIPCIGGVWNYNYLKKLIRKWKIELMFSEDDWFSSLDLIKISKTFKIPFHFLTPIDCLPLPKQTFKILSKCTKVYVPNSSYKILKTHGIKSIFLPHGVDLSSFYSIKRKNYDEIRLLWIGRDELRKNLWSMLYSFKHLIKKEKYENVKLIIRTDWNVPQSINETIPYIKRNKLEKYIIKEQMENFSHEQMRFIYNQGDVYVNTSCAGGFELGIIEANACGLPALVTNWRFMNENIFEGYNGWLIDIERLIDSPFSVGCKWAIISSKDLIDKMRFVIDNIDNIRKMKLQTRILVHQRYNWKKIGKLLYTHLTKE